MTYLSYYIKVKEALLKLADPEWAAGQAAYMRDQFKFIGIETPVRRQPAGLCGNTAEQLRVLCGSFWRTIPVCLRSRAEKAGGC